MRTVADLEQFLAEGLEGAALTVDSDDAGRELTTFTLPGAGRVPNRDPLHPWQASDRIRVVTRRLPGPRRSFRRVIISAYPVRPLITAPKPAPPQ